MRHSGKSPANLPQMAEVKRVIDENPYVKTIVLDIAMDAEPGQFVMVWVPGVDEKPMSLRKSGDEIALSIEARGECTKLMCSVKQGDTLGIRGPYGNSFSKEKDAILIGGGVGMPPIANLAETIGAKRVLQGARSKDRLLYTEQFPDMRIATDDGSEGHKGYVTELLEEELSKKPKVVYACGPELMMVAVAALCKRHGVRLEASLERYMRCGLGVCGSCVCGKRVVCTEGPIFDDGELAEMGDFGKFALTRSAKKVPLSEYYGGH